MGQIRFGIVGGGWRSLFYLRIAHELPDRFQVTGVMVRDEQKARDIAKAWGVPTFGDIERCMDGKPAFVVSSVPWPANPDVVRRLAGLRIPILTETPPAPDLDGLIALYYDLRNHATLQVAEQYPFQPIHAARQAVIDSGVLGDVSSALVSVAHGYHGVAVLRKYLGIGFEDALISARKFQSPIIAGPDRGGPPSAERTVYDSQTVATLDFGGKLGVFDFAGEQYFSWIRSSRVLVRGKRGEINDRVVRYLSDFRTPVTVELTRHDTGQDGNLEGVYHKGITAGSEWAYTNPFVPGRLSDDEIAVATCLQKMNEYVEGGPAFYGLADAAQDHYLGMMIDRAAATGETARTARQAWAM